MRQFVAIASNAFMELSRQPVFLLLVSSSALFCIFLACVPYFGFGDDPKMVKDSVLAVMLLTGLFGAVLSASSSVSREIRTGTALAVLAKPVTRAQFLLAKFAGVLGLLALLNVILILAALLASRMAYDAYGSTDFWGLGIFYAAVVLAFLMGAFSNYFLRRPFVSDTLFSVGALVVVAFVLINFLNKDGEWQAFGTGIDWRMVPAGVLILFAVWILAGLALACSTRLELISTLVACGALFMLGLISDYFFGRRAEAGVWWGTLLYNLLPNWHLLWMADTLEEGKTIPIRYLVVAAGYVIAYLGASVAVALCLFEDRELS